MKQNKSCSNCIKGVRINVNKDILCKTKGAVSLDFVCSRYKPITAVKGIAKQASRCVDCEFFILDAANKDGLPAIGFCQLFTVRQFDGEQKNACSKFCKKTELIVS